MREIKFRALELDSPCGINWVYGSYSLVNGWWMDHGEPDYNKPVVRHYIIENSGYKFEIAECTLGQFIGLNDKNNVEIYEGDINEMYTEWAGNYHADDEGGETLSIGVVSLIPSKGAVMTRVKIKDLISFDEKWKKHPWSLNVRGYRSKVIGNIHENPELLCAKK